MKEKCSRAETCKEQKHVQRKGKNKDSKIEAKNKQTTKKKKRKKEKKEKRKKLVKESLEA